MSHISSSNHNSSSSYCSECQRQIISSPKQEWSKASKNINVASNLTTKQKYQKDEDPNNSQYSFTHGSFQEAESVFKDLQKEIATLKRENQHKITVIEELEKKVKLTPSNLRARKTSVELQIEENKRTFEMLKSSLLSFGNKNAMDDSKMARSLGPDQENIVENQHRAENQQQKSVSTQRIPSKSPNSKTVAHLQRLEGSGQSSISKHVSSEFIIVSLQKRIKEYQIELIKLIEKVELHEKSTEWMYHFVDSFIKMVLEINRSGKFGSEVLVLKELSLKKRTKYAWKYLKEVLDKVLN